MSDQVARDARSAPKREDYADVPTWARDFEVFTKAAQAESRVTILKWTLLACAVCAPKDMPVEDAEREVNRINPTGISSGWTVSETRTFADATTNPVACAESPDRVHYYMTC